MLGLSGLQLARKYRIKNTDLKIFLMTAFETKIWENYIEYQEIRNIN